MMALKPFIDLKVSRAVTIAWLPEVLRNFYRTHEGLTNVDQGIRMCRLNEVAEIRWKDLHIFGTYPPNGGWASFRGIRLGASAYFDEIFYVLEAPVARSGSIIAFGVEVNGPGGTGDEAFEPSIVLAASFEDWIDRLRKDNWEDYGLFPGGIHRLQQERQMQLNKQLLSLNPKISWAKSG